MSIYVGGLITVIYTVSSGILPTDQNTILTELGDDILTETGLPLLRET